MPFNYGDIMGGFVIPYHIIMILLLLKFVIEGPIYNHSAPVCVLHDVINVWHHKFTASYLITKPKQYV